VNNYSTLFRYFYFLFGGDNKYSAYKKRFAEAPAPVKGHGNGYRNSHNIATKRGGIKAEPLHLQLARMGKIRSRTPGHVLHSHIGPTVPAAFPFSRFFRDQYT